MEVRPAVLVEAQSTVGREEERSLRV